MREELYMKDGKITKSAQNALADDLNLINKLTRRPFKANEIYTFNMILCDNDIDRDFEAFSVKCLHELKELFLGKTGIFDHDPKGSNQTARIFETKVEKYTDKKTKTGEDYYALKAKAYMIKNDKNKDLIGEIDGGIKKEVSVGCNVLKSICSICGSNTKNEKCEHIPGREYFVDDSKNLCYRILEQANDAYEWSFVAVPAQRHAGVVKNAADMIANENKSLKYISYLESIVEEFKTELKDKVEKTYAILQPEMSISIIKSMVEKLSLTELKKIREIQERSLNKDYIIQTENKENYKEKEIDIKNFSV